MTTPFMKEVLTSPLIRKSWKELLPFDNRFSKYPTVKIVRITVLLATLFLMTLLGV